MPSRISLSAHGLRFSIDLSRFEFDLKPGLSADDADWIIGVVELQVGSYRAKQDVTARASELQAFRNELARLLQSLTGQAVLTHLEEQFGLTIELVGGNGTLSGFVREHIGAALTFEEITIDQSFLTPALTELTQALHEFPVRQP